MIPSGKNVPPSDANTGKANAAITWLSVAYGVTTEVGMYDRLFLEAQSGAGVKDFIEGLKTLTAIVEPSLASAMPDDRLQFERYGYLVANRVDYQLGKQVFSLAVG